MFFGVYIQPDGARYFDPDMFADLASSLLECHEKGLVPYICGDFNLCIGYPNTLVYSSSWVYNENIDKITNKHGQTLFRDLCITCDAMPINCVKYINKEIANNFMYYSGSGKSQIDFTLTDDQGRKNICRFKIISHDLHLSDHRPIFLEIDVMPEIDLSSIFKRAQDLNLTNNDNSSKIVQLRGNYNYHFVNISLENMKPEIEENILFFINNNDIEGAVNLLHRCVIRAHKSAMLKTGKPSHTNVMSQANKHFDDYISLNSNENATEDTIQNAFNLYTQSRNKVNYDIMKN